MNISTTTHASPGLEHIGALVLRELAGAQERGERVSLDDLVRSVGVRRGELRSALSTLHRQGLVDVLRMRPTLAGFALGRAASALPMKPLRREIPAPPISFRAA